MLEDEMTLKRLEYQKKVQLENKRMAIDKKRREEAWKQKNEQENQKEISSTMQSDLLTENFMYLTAAVEFTLASCFIPNQKSL